MKFKRKKREKPFKKCPRCGERCLSTQNVCPECDLSFSRLKYASNKAAKKRLKKFDSDYIIYTNQYPSDVKFWKIVLLSVFLGMTGAHYYYVGKYVKGGLMTASFVYLLFCTIFNAELAYFLEQYFLYFPIGVAAFAWVISVSYVAFRKFKVPVIVETPEAAEMENLREVLEVKKEQRKSEIDGKSDKKSLKKRKKSEKITNSDDKKD